MTKATYHVKRSKLPILIAIVCFVLQGLIHGSINHPKKVGRENLKELSYGPWFVAASGFREVVAAWLWIKCDEMFHAGEYQALVPIMQTIVRLDPHQIDVYATGSWHMLYNFVDSEERSDRRYIPVGLAFLQEGIGNNPDTFDLYHDMGWMLFDDKLRRYEEATPYFIKAASAKVPSPPFYHHTIAHSYEHEGNIDKCIEWWNKFIADSEADLEKDPEENLWLQRLMICESNKSRVIIAKNHLDEIKAHPTDPKLDLNVKVIGRNKFRVYGTSNLTLGCRIYIDLQDDNYEQTLSKPFAWRLKNCTIVEDSAYVMDDGSFDGTIDLSQDPDFFPFRQGKYKLVISFNPRSAPSTTNNPDRLAAQEIYGWSGEGIADNPWLYIDKARSAHVNGKAYPLRMLRKEIVITKRQLEKKEPFDFTKVAGLPAWDGDKNWSKSQAGALAAAKAKSPALQ